jgi:mercuric reductase
VVVGVAHPEGALRHVTAAKRLQALQLVREGRLYDLGRVLDELVPAFPGRYFRQTLVRNGAEPLGDNRVDWTWEVFTATTQLGTHLDSLCHLREGDRGYGGLTASELEARYAADSVPQIVTRGRLVDVAPLGRGDVIGVDAVADLDVEPGDAVFFHTGWGRHWDEPDAYLAGEPGPAARPAAVTSRALASLAPRADCEPVVSAEQFDLLVVGAGSAAREAASRAALDHGASVALVERDLWGGQCPNNACKPTKQYVAAAELLRDLRAAGDLGIDTGTVAFDLARLRARKDWLIGTQEAWRQRFVDAGYEMVRGEAAFVDSSSIRVGERILTGDHILVANGSRTAVPPITGLDGVPWLDHIGMLELDELPSSLLVLGGGAVGLEFAQAFARFGSRVTLVQSNERIAPRSDPAAADEVAAALADDGVEVVTGTFVTEVRLDGDRILARLEHPPDGAAREVHSALLLLAAGRVPNVEALALERAGVEHGRGGIAVDERMRTSTPGIWAAGDVTATIQLTPVASEQAQVAVEDMFGSGARTMDYSFLPTAIFTDPELASVGLSEPEALAAGHDVGIATYPARDIVRPYYAATRDEVPRGLLKLVFDRASRRVLGVHAAVRGGSELVQGYAVALRLGATVDDLALTHYAFPTHGEAIHYAAETIPALAAAAA